MEIGDIKLEKPFFYNNEYGLRFEIGSSQMPVWANEERTVFNSEYFEVALARALLIFNSVFGEEDSISVVYQIFSDGRRKIRKKSRFLKLFGDISKLDICFTSHRELYTQDLRFKKHCWKRVSISNLNKSYIPYVGILKAIIDFDFNRGRLHLHGECYFVNHTTGVVFHLYDDRGLDVVATSKEALFSLYQKHNDLILSSDREHIESVFS